MKKWIATWTLMVASVVGAALFVRPGRPRDPAPQPLPPLARAALKHGMGRHGDDMTDLLFAVVMLDHDTAHRLAQAVADEPSLARPLAGDQLNASVPRAFFELQDELKARAAELSAAAASHDDAALADRYGKLAAGCVACHRLYLRPSK